MNRDISSAIAMGVAIVIYLALAVGMGLLGLRLAAGTARWFGWVS